MNRASQRRDMDGEVVTGAETERRKGVVDRGDSVTGVGDMEQLCTWLIALQWPGGMGAWEASRELT